MPASILASIRMIVIFLVAVVLAFSLWILLSEDPPTTPNATIVAIEPSKPAMAVTPSREVPRLDPTQEVNLKATEQDAFSAEAPATPPNAAGPNLGILPAEDLTFDQLKAHLNIHFEGGAIVIGTTANDITEGSLTSDRLRANDIIISINGITFKNSEELRTLLNGMKSGEDVLFHVIRHNSPLIIRVTLDWTSEELRPLDKTDDEFSTQEMVLNQNLAVTVSETDLLMETLEDQLDFEGGVIVQNMEEISVAQKEQLVPGDVILKFNDQTICELDELQEHLNKTGWNSTFTLTVLHKGQKRVITTSIPKEQ